MTRRVAAIDCGTNSIRLLIADIASTTLTDISREMRIVRLGEGVDRTGRLSAAALDRTMTALGEYADLIADAEPEAVRMVATSATRDAANAEEFATRVVDILGVAPEVISGDEEAWLSYTGATLELRQSNHPAPFLVTDIGGGSTEFVLGGPNPEGADSASPDSASPASRDQLQARSVNIGCVRLTERHLHGDPPAPAETAATTADIDAALDEAAAAVDAAQAKTLVGLAGSVTTVAAIALGLDRYLPDRIHHAVISEEKVREITARLLGMTRAERAAIPGMHPGRIDVIAAGALILDRIMARFGFAEVLVSEHDILDGIAFSVVP